MPVLIVALMQFQKLTASCLVLDLFSPGIQTFGSLLSYCYKLKVPCLKQETLTGRALNNLMGTQRHRGVVEGLNLWIIETLDTGSTDPHVFGSRTPVLQIRCNSSTAAIASKSIT